MAVADDAHAASTAPAPRPPPAPAAPPIPTAKAVDDDEDDALWKGIDLEFNKEGAKADDEPPDVELEEQKDEETT